MFLIDIGQNHQKRKRKDTTKMPESVDLWIAIIVQTSVLFISKLHVFMRS